MSYRRPLVTTAALIAIAIAALSGALLPYDRFAHAVAPEFVTGGGTRSIAENTPPGVNIGDPISATDADEGAVEYEDTLTYSLGGTDAASFDIDASTGQLITKAPLDKETKDSYSVTVTVDDGETDPAITQDVTISVTNVAEPPAAPIPPTVVSGEDNDVINDPEESTTNLKVVWHEPENTGDAITAYNVQYKKTTDTSFGSTNVTQSGTNKFATISNLDPDTPYDVRVQATNGEGTGPWSLVGTGSTNKAGNSPPAFPRTGEIVRNVFENTSVGQNVGAPVTASDADATTLTYRLEGPDAALFAFVTSSGQIRTKSPLNHENPDCGYVSTANPTACTYWVTVAVADGAGASDATAVKIVVADRTEPVVAPARPTVRATEKWSTRLDVSWKVPENTGPPITGYDVRYREGSSGSFSSDNCGSTGTDNCKSITGDKVTIVGLNAGKSHEVQVKTKLADGGASNWSDVGSGKTNQANREPRFDDRPSSGNGSIRKTDYTTSREVDENTRAGQSIGRAIRADDGDGDKRTFRLVESENTDTARAQVAKFDIDESSGQIRTKAALNHEATDCGYDGTDNPTTCTYTVKVEVWDGLDTHGVKEVGGDPVVDDTITVTINVEDEEEPPSAPAVTVTSPNTDTNTTLVVIWDAPENTGPDIDNYDVQYRKGSGSYSSNNCGSTADDNCKNISTTTTTIVGLTADTSYSVRVLARNAEGTSDWSRLVTDKTNKDNNDPPTFSETSTTLSVAENTASGQLVGTVEATDNDSTKLTYKLEGVDAASFNINTGNGQISTRASLNFEEKVSYSMRVKADDGIGSSSHNVTINVTDESEDPTKPSAPRVTATKDSGRSLDVTWNEPSGNTGKPPITDYDIRYREYGKGDTDWKLWAHGADSAMDNTGKTDRSAKITRVAPESDADPLKSSTQYQVEVRASNAEGTSDWSSIGTGTTGPGNIRPSFDRTEAVVKLTVDENTGSGQNVGSAVSASDDDGNRLTYTLEGPNKDSFTIVSSGNSGGQIKTKAALDYETRNSYSLTVKVDDGSKRANSSAAKSVTVTVDDVDEIPPAPSAPTVSGIPGSTDSVRVTWSAPSYTGPPITDYEVHYGEAGSGGWTTLVGRTGADRSATITDLTAGTNYAVQVRAKSAEGTSDWSSSGTGKPNPDVANRNPTFSGGSRSFSVAENTAAGADVGSAISATDPDGDSLTYSLEGTNADSFSILSTGSGGQIQTSADLNHEAKSSYSVTVRVIDGRGGNNTAGVTINVTDVDGEAPGIPVAPDVTAASSTSLQASWNAPANEGPPINDYDYRYRGPTGNWTEVTGTTITATTVTITGLTASTYYDVEVRAKNAEGMSDWSNAGIGQTLAPGANNPPIFSEGTSATRSVSAAAAAGTTIGDPVAATDADTADTITYSLEGTDAASFSINAASGQILTKSGVDLTVGTTYNVTVAADDTRDTTRIPVSIKATAEPPNNPPVFSEGASASRSVLETAAVGTSLGSPVRATDADTGDTLTYTLSGTDAASFRINSASGQLSTGVALDADVKASYSVSVNASDGKATATIAVTVTVTPVTTFGCATKGAVPDAAANPGLVADCEALLQARSKLEGGARLLSWSEYIPVNNWNGVTVRGTPARVTRIILRGGRAELYSGRLQGTIPAELGELAMLTELNLHSNQLTGTIPAELNGLSRLEKLLIHNNRLSGTIPNLSGLTSLKMLWLSGKEMNLSGGIPAWLNGMSGLESLSLWGNSLSGPIPPLTGMTSLSLLKIQSNNLTGGIPSWFGQMQSIRGLYIHLNPLGGTIPPELGNLTRLRRMWLHSSNLTGTIPVELANMTNLATLNLRNNQLTGPIPAAIGSMTELQQLLLHNNQLTGAIPSSLGSLSNLRQLAASNNLLAGAIPSELGGLDRLTLLWLSENQLSGTIPAQLGDLGDTLTKIRLADNSFADTACLPAGIANVAGNDYADAGLAACP